MERRNRRKGGVKTEDGLSGWEVLGPRGLCTGNTKTEGPDVIVVEDETGKLVFPFPTKDYND